METTCPLQISTEGVLRLLTVGAEQQGEGTQDEECDGQGCGIEFGDGIPVDGVGRHGPLLEELDGAVDVVPAVFVADELIGSENVAADAQGDQHIRLQQQAHRHRSQDRHNGKQIAVQHGQLLHPGQGGIGVPGLGSLGLAGFQSFGPLLVIRFQ